MKTTCPKCGTSYDIPDNTIISRAAAIHGKRSKRQITAEQQKIMQQARHKK